MSDAMAIDSVDGGSGQPQQQQQPMQRRTSMTEDEQKERRASIQAIMKDPALTPQERRKSIQALMDGRRRSSTASLGGGGGGDMAAAAAAAAAAYYGSSSDDESASDANMRGSSSRGSSLASGSADASQQLPGGAVGSRRQRSSLRGSFIDGVAAMNTGAADDGAAASSGRSLFNSERRGSHLSSASSVDPSSGHHLGSAIGSSRKMEKTRPHCDHYERKCTIVSPCCGLAFGCRICHDDCPVLPPPIFSQRGAADAMAMADDKGGSGDDGEGGAAAVTSEGHGSDSGLHGDGAPKRRIGRSASMPSAFTEEETHHDIDRFAIREVICRDCYCRQSSKT